MKKLLSRFTPLQWLAIGLIVLGLLIMIPRLRGMFSFYKEARYAAENHFVDGNLSPDLIRPWMSLRYVAVAYAVPQRYLYDTAGIRPHPETSMLSLSRLNRQLNLGEVNGEPAIMQVVRDAIVAYRANPVVTGLLEQKVADWMTIQYIANSTGVSAETIFAGLGLPPDGNANKPLGFLSETTSYPGGTRALVAAVQKILEEQGVIPARP
jgi:hypothetical protein